MEIKKYENEQWSKSGMSICGGVYRQYINIQGVYSSSNIALALAKIQYILMKCVKQNLIKVTSGRKQSVRCGVEYQAGQRPANGD